VSLYKDKDEQTSERVRQASLRTQNEEALLEMSQHKLNVAAGALLQVLENLPQVTSPTSNLLFNLSDLYCYLI
jgi:hypothetical protein